MRSGLLRVHAEEDVKALCEGGEVQKSEVTANSIRTHYDGL